LLESYASVPRAIDLSVLQKQGFRRRQLLQSLEEVAKVRLESQRDLLPETFEFDLGSDKDRGEDAFGLRDKQELGAILIENYGFWPR
jgi:hypothetical protein